MRVLALAPPALSPFAEEALRPLLSEERHQLCGCLVDARPSKPIAERLRTNLRRGRGGYVLIMMATLPLRRRVPAISAVEFCGRAGIPVLETLEPYSEDTLAWIGSLAPDVLVLIGGFGIVKRPLIESAPRGILSYHHGDMRRYRGQPPGLWELYNGEREMGVTVQLLSESLDAGIPVVERTVQIRPDDTPARLRERALGSSVDMLHTAVERLDDPAWQPETIDTYGPVYTLPNLRQWLALNARVARRRARARLS